jgi:hypothetical protein
VNVHLHNTSKIVDVNGVPARVWEGHTDAAIPVIAFVTRIAVERTEDTAEFERDLAEMSPPSPAVEAWPARMLID